jgi:ferritin-like metal-binding protein YciE
MGDLGQKKLIKLLIEAHSEELALIPALKAHLGVTERGTYRSLLANHLRETEHHAELLEKRLTRLGHSRSLMQFGYGLVQEAIAQGLTLAKKPIDLMRGFGDTKEKMLKNARDEAMTEAREIATYDAIEHLARSIGDHETAELASQIRVDEESMLESLRKEIPILTDLVIRSSVPLTERDGEEPWPGYDELTVDEIVVELKDASESMLVTVRNYELKNKTRTTVIQETERVTVPNS